eukprot:6242032-Ditylum_brightwellii.AAC.1
MSSAEQREIRLMQEKGAMIIDIVMQIITFDNLCHHICDSGQDGRNGSILNTFDCISSQGCIHGASYSFNIGGPLLPREYE